MSDVFRQQRVATTNLLVQDSNFWASVSTRWTKTESKPLPQTRTTSICDDSPPILFQNARQIPPLQLPEDANDGAGAMSAQITHDEQG